MPLPASVVVAPVAMSTRRIRLLIWSCDASWENTLNEEGWRGVWCDWHHLRQKHCLCAAAYIVCALSNGRGGLRGVQGMQRVQARGTHRDERITAARLDGDATRVLELGDSARAVEEANDAAAGERGGRPGGDFDTADTVAASVLRCIMGQHTEDMLVSRRSGRTGNWCGPYAVCEAGVCRLCGMAACGGAGAADAPRRARRCRSGRW